MGANDFNFDVPPGERYQPSPERVAGQLQEAGPEWQTRVLAAEYAAEVDRVVLDLRRAYDVPVLRRLEREFIFDRRDDGQLTVIDHVEFAEPADFGSALISFGTCDIEGHRLVFTDGPTQLLATVELAGAELTFDRNSINQPPHPLRIGVPNPSPAPPSPPRSGPPDPGDRVRSHAPLTL